MGYTPTQGTRPSEKAGVPDKFGFWTLFPGFVAQKGTPLTQLSLSAAPAWPGTQFSSSYST